MPRPVGVQPEHDADLRRRPNELPAVDGGAGGALVEAAAHAAEIECLGAARDAVAAGARRAAAAGAALVDDLVLAVGVGALPVAADDAPRVLFALRPGVQRVGAPRAVRARPRAVARARRVVGGQRLLHLGLGEVLAAARVAEGVPQAPRLRVAHEVDGHHVAHRREPGAVAAAAQVGGRGVRRELGVGAEDAAAEVRGVHLGRQRRRARAARHARRGAPLAVDAAEAADALARAVGEARAAVVALAVLAARPAPLPEALAARDGARGQFVGGELEAAAIASRLVVAAQHRVPAVVATAAEAGDEAVLRVAQARVEVLALLADDGVDAARAAADLRVARARAGARVGALDVAARAANVLVARRAADRGAPGGVVAPEAAGVVVEAVARARHGVAAPARGVAVGVVARQRALGARDVGGGARDDGAVAARHVGVEVTDNAALLARVEADVAGGETLPARVDAVVAVHLARAVDARVVAMAHAAGVDGSGEHLALVPRESARDDVLRDDAREVGDGLEEGGARVARAELPERRLKRLERGHGGVAEEVRPRRGRREVGGEHDGDDDPHAHHGDQRVARGVDGGGPLVKEEELRAGVPLVLGLLGHDARLALRGRLVDALPEHAAAPLALHRLALLPPVADAAGEAEAALLRLVARLVRGVAAGDGGARGSGGVAAGDCGGVAVGVGRGDVGLLHDGAAVAVHEEDGVARDGGEAARRDVALRLDAEHRRDLLQLPLGELGRGLGAHLHQPEPHRRVVEAEQLLRVDVAHAEGAGDVEVAVVELQRAAAAVDGGAAAAVVAALLGRRDVVGVLELVEHVLRVDAHVAEVLVPALDLPVGVHRGAAGVVGVVAAAAERVADADGRLHAERGPQAALALAVGGLGLRGLAHLGGEVLQRRQPEALAHLGFLLQEEHHVLVTVPQALLQQDLLLALEVAAAARDVEVVEEDERREEGHHQEPVDGDEARHEHREAAHRGHLGRRGDAEARRGDEARDGDANARLAEGEGDALGHGEQVAAARRGHEAALLEGVEPDHHRVGRHDEHDEEVQRREQRQVAPGDGHVEHVAAGEGDADLHDRDRGEQERVEVEPEHEEHEDHRRDHEVRVGVDGALDQAVRDAVAAETDVDVRVLGAAARQVVDEQISELVVRIGRRRPAHGVAGARDERPADVDLRAQQRRLRVVRGRRLVHEPQRLRVLEDELLDAVERALQRAGVAVELEVRVPRGVLHRAGVEVREQR
mmetsp:Transcript_34542/g.106698  ORF Transcript_34542/g.106698 Transcript_34542/m.106698 type:complete len:1234 (-) Transcript_34542:784-4485(-)